MITTKVSLIRPLACDLHFLLSKICMAAIALSLSTFCRRLPTIDKMKIDIQMILPVPELIPHICHQDLGAFIAPI